MNECCWVVVDAPGFWALRRSRFFIRSITFFSCNFRRCSSLLVHTLAVTVVQFGLGTPSRAFGEYRYFASCFFFCLILRYPENVNNGLPSVPSFCVGATNSSSLSEIDSSPCLTLLFDRFLLLLDLSRFNIGAQPIFFHFGLALISFCIGTTRPCIFLNNLGLIFLMKCVLSYSLI